MIPDILKAIFITLVFSTNFILIKYNEQIKLTIETNNNNAIRFAIVGWIFCHFFFAIIYLKKLNQKLPKK